MPDSICSDISTEAAAVCTVMRRTADEKTKSPKLRCIEVAMSQRYMAPAASKKTAEARSVQPRATL